MRATKKTADTMYKSPCAAQDVRGEYGKAQAAQCTHLKFKSMLYGHPMSHELFGKTKAELNALMLQSTAAFTRINWEIYPAESRERAGKRGEDPTTCWWSWNKRSCGHYVTELPLRYIAMGSQPWEAPPELAQGLGRKCMKRCMGLTSAENPLHNR